MLLYLSGRSSLSPVVPSFPELMPSQNVTFELRNGHGDGHTDVAFTPDGSAILTGGSDGECRLWRKEDEFQDSESFPVGSAVYAIAVQGDKYFVGSDADDIKSYLVEDGSYDGAVTRFSAEVYHLDVSRDSKLLAGGGGDFEIKIITLSDSGQKVLSGHSAPILSIAFSPEADLIASSSCDGTVRIWSTNDAKEVHRISDCHPKSNDFVNSVTLARMSWSPDGQCLAVPSRDKVLVLSTSSWSEKSSVTHTDFCNISICSYNKSGSILCASNTSGRILFWNSSSLTSPPIAIFVHEDSSAITSLKFAPKIDTQIVFCDEKGKFSFVEVVQESDVTANAADVLDDMYGIIGDDDTFTEEDFLKEQEKKKSAGSSSRAIADDDDDDDEEIVSQSKKKKKSAFIDDEADDDGDEDVGRRETEAANDEAADDDVENFIDDDDDDVRSHAAESPAPANPVRVTEPTQMPSVTDIVGEEDDGGISINAIKARYEKTIFNDETSNGSKNADGDGEKGAEVVANVPPVPQTYTQPAFQPGSTPKTYEQRFMLWNETGIVRAYATETEDTIDVEFHDIATHHTINIKNSQDYTMAALSSEALVLANDEADELASSRILCMNFVTWDESNKEWTVDLPEDEFAEAVALGSGFVAVATNKRFVRLFTIGGTQMYMFSIPGSVVCMSGQESSLFVVYNAAPGTRHNPVLAAFVLKINFKTAILVKQRLPSSVPVSLAPNTLLAWAGFTDEGTPCVVDTEGYVRLLKDMMGNTWIPIANLKEKLNSKTDNNFVIGLSEINQQIRCIFCKGSRYPAVVPRPYVTFAQFELPFCGRTATKGKLEESHIRSKLSNSILEKLLTEEYDVEVQTQRNYKSMNESLLRLFAMAVGSDCEALALEISYLMPSGKSVESAIRYALQKRRTALAEKLNEVVRQKEKESEEQAEPEPEPEVYQTSPRKSAVPVVDEETVVLRPKSITSNNKSNDCNVEQDEVEEDENDCDSDSESSMQSKRHLDAGKKRKRPLVPNNGKLTSCKELGFDVYLSEVFQSVKDENPDMDDSEVEDVVKDMFLSLPFAKRREYQARSEDSSLSKRSKTC